MPIYLADLVAAATSGDVLSQELLLATDLGLPTTAWQTVQAIPVLFNIQANLTASYSTTAAQFAQGGYASYAAQMVDSGGNPITQWMDLRATDQYNITRNPATYASGSTPYTNTNGASYPYSPTSPLHFQHPTTGATYTSTGTGSLAVSTSGTVSLQADVVGAASTAGAGITLILLTPFAGVTLQALTTSVVGSNAEINSALLSRGQNKLGTIDNALAGGTQPYPIPQGPDGAYKYVALTIPQGVGSQFPPYSVTAQVTRVGVQTDTGNGNVLVYLANASGGSSAGDVQSVNAAIQALCVGDSNTCIVNPAVNVAFNATFTVYIQQSVFSTGGVNLSQSNQTPQQVAESNIHDDLASYFAAVQIGGFNTSTQNVIPIAEISDQIFAANPGTTDLVYQQNTGVNLYVGQNGIPTVGILTMTVVFI